MDKASKKSMFRKEIFSKLNKQKINNYKRDKIIINRLYTLIKKAKIQDIMIYIPLKTEPNIAPLIKLLREKGYNLYVPFIVGNSFKLVSYRLPLKINKFKIKEPNNSYKKVKKIDLAIVPLLGIDKSYKRVGFGKGMYDRFYERFNKKIAKTVFLQRDIYYIDEYITDNYDISSDCILTNSIIEIYMN